MNNTAFDTVIAEWEEIAHCEMPTRAGASCRRGARWRIDLHGCEQAIVCGQHRSTWTRETVANFQQNTPRCFHCGQVFACFDDAVRITAI